MSARRQPVGLRVRLLADPCLWCWEIVARRREHLVLHSSWASDWAAYETVAEALAAGRARLAEFSAHDPRVGRVADRRKGASAP